ncbi:hypothetical protein ACRALDRAFT_2014581 [Sodiomyces alcalophilus JCM 7366]|uniref:uncharacterized protein n=1 Tax=Sodiomyces alcalophilus JCM 7366 TaxID=591952 RepID=UPI0039B3ECCA
MKAGPRHIWDALDRLVHNARLDCSLYDSVLLSALAVMGIRQDGGWHPAEDYTSVYSADEKDSLELPGLFYLVRGLA